MIDRMLCRLHAWISGCPVFARLTLLTRVSVAGGFVMPGLTKAMGNRFTTLGPESPVGAFFEAMYQTGWYWRFLGISQIAAAVMLMIPRTALLGATMFFGIILNIFVITVAVGFTGTWLITGMMLVAATYLLVWDYPRLRPLLGLFGGPAPSGVTRLGVGPVAIAGAFLAIPGAFYAAVLRAKFGIGHVHPLMTSLPCLVVGMAMVFGPVVPEVVRCHGGWMRARLLRRAQGS